MENYCINCNKINSNDIFMRFSNNVAQYYCINCYKPIRHFLNNIFLDKNNNLVIDTLLHNGVGISYYYNGNKKNRKLVFLGDMLELGKKSKKFHRMLSTVINRSSIDKVFVYGKHIKETFNYLSDSKKGKIFRNLN